MARSTEQSYALIREYLQSRRLPATIKDMIEANVTSRPTLFRLLRPESFADAAVFGIKCLNNTKPYFFVYDENLILEMLEKVNPEVANQITKQHDVLAGAAKLVAANSVVLDDIERRVIQAVKQHREEYAKDDILRDNFTKIPQSAESYLDTLDRTKEITSADLVKFRTLILSMFVSSFNAEGD